MKPEKTGEEGREKKEGGMGKDEARREKEERHGGKGKAE